MNTHLTLKSGNRKVGPIPVSTTSLASCPDACPLKAGGCYAKGGPLAIHWRKVTEGAAGDDFETFTAKVASLPDGQLWRHNQAGDLPGHGDAIDGRQLGQLVAANAGKRGFTYTHKPMTRAANREAVQAANAGGFTVNLSANTLAEADTLAGLGIAPVVVVLDAPDGHCDTGGPQGRDMPGDLPRRRHLCQLPALPAARPQGHRGVPRARRREAEGCGHRQGITTPCRTVSEHETHHDQAQASAGATIPAPRCGPSRSPATRRAP
jgi:hypothetical protein